MRSKSAKARYIKELTTLINKKGIDSEWTLPIKSGLNEFEEIYPACSYDEIVNQFGEPREVLADHLDAISYTEKSSKHPRLYIIFTVLILTIILSALGIILYNIVTINIATQEYIIFEVNDT